jgi:hypothetical protein
VRTTTTILLISFVCGIIFSACTKTAVGTQGPAGPQGPAGANSRDTPNAITGYVNLFDQYGNAETSYAGLTVSTKVDDSTVNAQSDSIGNFRLPGLIIGNYDLLFKKTGFDSLMVHVVNSGGDEDKFIGIVQVNEHVTSKITSESFSLVQGVFYMYDSILSLQLYVNIDGPPMSETTRRDFGFYFSRSNQVNMNKYDVFANSYGNSLISTNNTFPYTYDLSNFTGLGLNYQAGDTVFFKTYVLPVNHTPTTWFDYSTNETINYPYVGDSTLNFFIWP